MSGCSRRCHVRCRRRSLRAPLVDFIAIVENPDAVFVTTGMAVGGRGSHCELLARVDGGESGGVGAIGVLEYHAGCGVFRGVGEGVSKGAGAGSAVGDVVVYGELDQHGHKRGDSGRINFEYRLSIGCHPQHNAIHQRIRRQRRPIIRDDVAVVVGIKAKVGRHQIAGERFAGFFCQTVLWSWSAKPANLVANY